MPLAVHPFNGYFLLVACTAVCTLSACFLKLCPSPHASQRRRIVHPHGCRHLSIAGIGDSDDPSTVASFSTRQFWLQVRWHHLVAPLEGSSSAQTILLPRGARTMRRIFSLVHSPSFRMQMLRCWKVTARELLLVVATGGLALFAGTVAGATHLNGWNDKTSVKGDHN